MSDPQNLSREVPLIAGQSALLFIDVQNWSVRYEGGEFKAASQEEIAGKYGYYFERLHKTAIPNMQRLQAACRRAGVEVLYTTIESLTKDGRDRSLDYKITGFHVPKGAWDGKVIDEIAPMRTRSSCRSPPPAFSSPRTSTTSCAISVCGN